MTGHSGIMIALTPSNNETIGVYANGKQVWTYSSASPIEVYWDGKLVWSSPAADR
jgi:hypothetical protein